VAPTDHVRRIFATFDTKDVSALAAFMTDDLMRLSVRARGGKERERTPDQHIRS
jgi:ketosteroid isomerase-like protein